MILLIQSKVTRRIQKVPVERHKLITKKCEYRNFSILMQHQLSPSWRHNGTGCNIFFPVCYRLSCSSLCEWIILTASQLESWPLCNNQRPVRRQPIERARQGGSLHCTASPTAPISLSNPFGAIWSVLRTSLEFLKTSPRLEKCKNLMLRIISTSLITTCLLYNQPERNLDLIHIFEHTLYMSDITHKRSSGSRLSL